MRSAKPGLWPQTYPGSEARQIFHTVARRYGGHKIKAVVGFVAKDLRVTFDLAFRARKGRIGGRAFPKLLTAYHRWLDAQANKELAALEARVRALSLRVAALGGEPPIEPCDRRSSAN